MRILLLQQTKNSFCKSRQFLISIEQNIFLVQTKTYSYLWDAIQGFLMDGTPALSTGHSDHMQMVHQGDYTFVSVLTALELEAAEDCNLAIMKEKFFSLLYSCRNPK